MSTQTRSGPDVGERRLNSPVAVASGALFVLLGVAGFVLSGSRLAVGPDAFGVTMVRDVLHVAIGAMLVAAAILGARQARFANTAAGLAYVAMVVIGLSITGAGATLAAPDLPHLVLGIALTTVGLRGDARLP